MRLICRSALQSGFLQHWITGSFLFRKEQKKRFTLLLIFILSVFFIPSVYPKETLNTITLNLRDESPYNIGRPSDYVAKRVYCALNSMGQPFKAIEVPWKRAQINVENNYSQGIFPSGWNQRWENKLVKSIPINEGTIYWIVDKQSSIAPLEANFDHFSIGVIRGTHAYYWLKERSSNIVGLHDHLGLLGMLQKRRISAALTSRSSLLAAVKYSGFQLFKFNVIKAYRRVQYVLFAREFIDSHPEFLGQFDGFLGSCIHQYPKMDIEL